MGSSGYAVAEVSTPVRKKKPNFIKRWFSKMARESCDEQYYGGPDEVKISSTSNNLNQNKCIKFTVYPAQGGRIVEIEKRVKNTNNSNYIGGSDENSTSLYVITHDKDFGHEIDKIITMEALR